ncbi:coiled-coil domain-containing protein 138-like [Dendronephthya gigantea]|uniref:coiled-coil domain-containing protein 138-like n=1 Tax=Dendronephthya gigantea TaxID=151771 RepID=UPI001068FA29|nr:coiled-coil domain-containing protein 138-like [Dendronephthya gigantea]
MQRSGSPGNVKETPYFDKAYFEYYTNSAGTSNSSHNVSRHAKVPNQSAPKPMSISSNNENASLVQPSSHLTHWSSDTMTNHEKEHYKKALDKIYIAVKSRTQQLNTDSGSDRDDSFERKQSPPSPYSSKHDFGEETLDIRRRQTRKTRLNEFELQDIYEELRQISKKLKEETHALQVWEEELQEREAMLNDREYITNTQQEFVSETLEEEIQRQCTIIDQEYQGQVNELQKVIHEKSKEANRLRDSFNTIRTTHDDLRKQFIEMQDQNRLLESQTLSLQQRLNNLLRKNEYQAKKEEAEKNEKFNEHAVLTTKRDNVDSFKAPSNSKFRVSGVLDVLSCLLIWISDSELEYVSPEETELRGKAKSSEAAYGKCVKILPPLADLISYIPTVNPDVMHPLLKFVYSVMLYMEHSPHVTQKSVLVSTFRRMGEELYKPEAIKHREGKIDGRRSKMTDEIYIRSPNMDERMLSTLIILKTISRADYLSHTFEVLKSDLREQEGKRLFINHNGINVIMAFMKPKNVLLESAIDVTLQMSMESDVVTEFLIRCSTSNFFNVCTNLLQEKGLQLKIVEKLSIILQRLSKIRNNRRYFEAFQLVPVMHELLRLNDTDNAFLSLNLRSVLVNLNVVHNA